MKKKIFGSIVIISVVAINLSVLSGNNSLSFVTLEKMMSINEAQAEIIYCDFVNDQNCEAYDPDTGLSGTGCEDWCDADSGTACSGPESCYYSVGGCW